MLTLILAGLLLTGCQGEPGAPTLVVEKLGEEKVVDGSFEFRLVTRDFALGCIIPGVGKAAAVVAYGMSDGKRKWKYEFDWARNPDVPLLLADGDRVGIQGHRFSALLHASTGEALYQKTFDPGANPPHPIDRAVFLSGNWISIQGQDLISCGRDGKVVGVRKAASREIVQQLKTSGGVAMFRSDAGKLNADKTEQITWSMIGLSPDARELWRYHAQPYIEKNGAQTRKVLLGFTSWWTDSDWMIGMSNGVGGIRGYLAPAKTGKLQQSFELPARSASGSPSRINGRSVVELAGTSYFLWGTSQQLPDGSFRSHGSLGIYSVTTGKPVFSSAEEEPTYAAAEHEGLLILDDPKGRVRAFDASKAAVKWTYTGGRTGSVISVGGSLCFAKDRELVVLDPATGDVRKTIKFAMPTEERYVWKVREPAGFAVYSNPNFGFFDAERLAVGVLNNTEAGGPPSCFMHGLRDPAGLRAIDVMPLSDGVWVRVFELKISRP